LVAISGVAFAAILILMQIGFQHALFASGVRLHRRLTADLFLINPQSSHLNAMKVFSRRRLYQALGHDGVRSVAPLYLALGWWKNPDSRVTRGILVTGFDPSNRVFDLADVDANRRKIQFPDIVLFDEASRPEYGPIAARFHQRQRVTAEVSNRRITVGGLFTIGPSFGIDGNLITSDLNFLRLFPHRKPGLIDVGLIWLDAGADATKVAANLRAGLPADVRLLSKEEYLEREQAYWRHNTPIGYVFAFGVIMGLVVGTVIVYQTLFANVSDHIAEYATLKAMGYTNRHLFGVVLQQAVLLALLGYGPGLAISWQLYGMTEAATGLPMQLTAETSLRVLTLTIAMCCTSGAITLRKIRAADPAEIF